MRMLEKVLLPAAEADDINSEFTTWRNGRCVSLDEGAYISLYIDHEDIMVSERVMSDTGEETEQQHKAVAASPIRVRKPMSRDMAINAAEMSAYRLKDAMAVASFNAALARKSRLNPGDEEVAEHDRFIEWVRSKLTEIGV